MEKLEVKRPLGRTRRRWENNIKMDLQEIELEHQRDWSGWTRRRLWRSF